MRTGFLLSRNRLRALAPTCGSAVRRQALSALSARRHEFKDDWKHARTPHPLRLAASLSPVAFLRLSEEEHEDGRSGEEQMLEASRDEIEKKVPEDLRGVRRVIRTIWVILDQYLYEPIATSLRFLHLVVIFVPVLMAVPVMWMGKRQIQRDNERQGTLWWYGFLVSSMERAGPAFIKVRTTTLCASRW